MVHPLDLDDLEKSPIAFYRIENIMLSLKNILSSKTDNIVQ